MESPIILSATFFVLLKIVFFLLRKNSYLYPKLLYRNGSRGYIEIFGNQQTLGCS
jgi:hypothetical protein